MAEHTPSATAHWGDDLTPKIKAGDERVLINGIPPPTDIRILSEENFQLSRRAVNAHEALVEALNKIVIYWNDLHPQDLRQARAALTLARGETDADR